MLCHTSSYMAGIQYISRLHANSQDKQHTSSTLYVMTSWNRCLLQSTTSHLFIFGGIQPSNGQNLESVTSMADALSSYE